MPVQAQRGGGGVAPIHSQQGLGGFTARKDLEFFVQEAEWVSRQVRTASKISHPLGSEPRTVQPVASRCTDYDILAAIYY